MTEAGNGFARVSCVIPVFNEAERIGGVLAAVAGHPLVSEVIVVDDGSTDRTAEIVGRVRGVRLVRLGQNQGKSRALHAGLMLAAGPTILLLDGDLAGLAPAHVSALLGPVLEGRAEVAISLRQNAPRLWKLIGLDYIAGERVLAKEMLAPHLDALRGLPMFGFEVWLNRYCVAWGCRIAVVPLPGVRSPFKSGKRGLRKGLLADAAMMRDIFLTVSPLDAVAQIRAMLRLKVPPTGRNTPSEPEIGRT